MQKIGKLFIVATPIGNLEDITIRAIKILLTVPLIACEDTRKTGLLLNHLSKKYSLLINGKQDKSKLISFYDEIEERKVPLIIKSLKEGQDVALVSESGTPLISDPGFKLIKACLKYSVPIEPIPGPSAAICALVASGLPTNNFYFIGFLPVKISDKEKLFRQMHQSFETLKRTTTVIIYEAPHRLIETLEVLRVVWGNIEVVVARELTKIHQEVFRGNILQAITHFHKPKGEFVILFAVYF